MAAVKEHHYKSSQLDREFSVNMSEEDFSAELEEQQQDVLTTMTRLLECQSRMMQQQEEERKRIREEVKPRECDYSRRKKPNKNALAKSGN